MFRMMGDVYDIAMYAPETVDSTWDIATKVLNDCKIK